MYTLGCRIEYVPTLRELYHLGEGVLVTLPFEEWYYWEITPALFMYIVMKHNVDGDSKNFTKTGLFVGYNYFYGYDFKRDQQEAISLLVKR